MNTQKSVGQAGYLPKYRCPAPRRGCPSPSRPDRGHDSFPLRVEEDRYMTVCIAVICKWAYPSPQPGGQPEPGEIILTASDRMFTAFDAEWEPNQTKVATFGRRTIALVAGDISVHSLAIRKVSTQLKGDTEANPERVALLYGRAIQDIRLRWSRLSEQIFRVDKWSFCQG
jgi:hypothetical protein